MPKDMVQGMAETLSAPLKLLMQLPVAMSEALMSGGQQIDRQIRNENPARQLMEQASQAIQAPFQMIPPPPIPAAMQGGEFYRSPAAETRTVKRGRAASGSMTDRTPGREILTNIF